MTIDFRKPTPLYKQITTHIKSQIQSNQLKSGEKIRSHQELAHYYKVSLITVKKALSELINEGFLFSRVGKGTYISDDASRRRFDDHINLGLVLRDLNSPFFSQILEKIEEETSRSGYNLLVATSGNDPSREDEHINRYVELGVQGLIIASTSNRSHPSPTIHSLHENNFPYVVISYIQDLDTNIVNTDHEMGAFMATEHLARQGYKKIGYINSEAGYELGEVRKAGFLRALQQYDQLFDEKFHFRLRKRSKWFEYESGYEIGKQVIEMNHQPDAMFIYSDLAALGFEKAVMESGLNVPDDIAIVGFDNIKRGVVAAVPLTTIAQPVQEISHHAIGIIIHNIRGQATKNRIILKPKLIIRTSCGAGSPGSLDKVLNLDMNEA